MALPRHSKHCYRKPGAKTGLFLWRAENDVIRCVRVEKSAADRFSNQIIRNRTHSGGYIKCRAVFSGLKQGKFPDRAVIKRE